MPRRFDPKVQASTIQASEDESIDVVTWPITMDCFWDRWLRDRLEGPVRLGFFQIPFRLNLHRLPIARIGRSHLDPRSLTD